MSHTHRLQLLVLESNPVPDDDTTTYCHIVLAGLDEDGEPYIASSVRCFVKK